VLAISSTLSVAGGWRMWACGGGGGSIIMWQCCNQCLCASARSKAVAASAAYQYLRWRNGNVIMWRGNSVASAYGGSSVAMPCGKSISAYGVM